MPASDDRVIIGGIWSDALIGIDDTEPSLRVSVKDGTSVEVNQSNADRVLSSKLLEAVNSMIIQQKITNLYNALARGYTLTEDDL